ncbi:MAG TPA: anti-sigma factor [Gemmatimonadaceae bacterium]
MNAHCSWEELNDLVDGVLSPADESRVQAHLDRCSECHARLDDLQVTLREVASVAREIAPPEEAWPSLREEIERRKLVTLETSAPETAIAGGRGRSPSRWRLAAAAVVLVAVSSAVTAIIIRNGASSVPVVATTPAPAPGGAPAGAATTLPAAMTEAERGYLASVEELTAALEMARRQLSAETIAIVERNLALIDAAIAESRAALLQDPGNRVLMAVLDGTYRQKLELLRRAAQVGSS